MRRVPDGSAPTFGSLGPDQTRAAGDLGLSALCRGGNRRHALHLFCALHRCHGEQSLLRRAKNFSQWAAEAM